MMMTKQEGLLVFWDAAETDRMPFSAAMHVAGLAQYAPEEPDRSMALRSAIRDAVENFNLRIHGQPVEPKGLEKGVVGFDAIRIVRGAAENEYPRLFTVHADENNDVTITNNHYANGFTNRYDAEQFIHERFVAQLTRLPGSTAGSLIRNAIVRGLKGVALSRGGKCFYLPSTSVVAYESLAALINHANPVDGLRMKSFRYPMEPLGLDEIVSALQSSVVEMTTRMQQELQACNDEGRRMRSDARDNRNAELKDEHDKLLHYQSLLGVSLDEVLGLIEHTQGLIAMNALLEVSA